MQTSDTVQSLVVRNIGDIESALSHAHKIGEDLWEAVQSTLRERLEPVGWHVSEFDEDNGSVWFAPREWLTPDLEKPDADPWFSIEVFAGLNGEYDETYLAEFLQSGPNGAGIALWFMSNDMLKKRTRQRLIGRDTPELAALRQAGFEIDSQQWIRFPIRLEVEAVAQGADDEDFADALRPLHDAIDAAFHNVERFAALVQSASAE